MRYKTEISYLNLFENLKLLLHQYNINIDSSNLYMMTDFENPLRKALKKSFPNSNILGCFFHYLKAIVTKFKDYGLLKKNY